MSPLPMEPPRGAWAVTRHRGEGRGEDGAEAARRVGRASLPSGVAGAEAGKQVRCEIGGNLEAEGGACVEPERGEAGVAEGVGCRCAERESGGVSQKQECWDRAWVVSDWLNSRGSGALPRGPGRRRGSEAEEELGICGWFSPTGVARGDGGRLRSGLGARRSEQSSGSLKPKGERATSERAEAGEEEER